MAQSIGPNTNAPPDLVRSDCVLLAGEDAASCEPLLDRYWGPKDREHAFRGYIFQRRASVTTIISGMGTACIEPLLWELSRGACPKRIVLAGTAGAMPRSDLLTGQAYPIGSARAGGNGLQAIGLAGEHGPRWTLSIDIATASIVSTDFYYGFGVPILDRDHPLHDTRLADLFAESREDLVDMEVASFYALSHRFMPPHVQFLAIKAAANPAGVGEVHLANTPTAMESCLALAVKLLS